MTDTPVATLDDSDTAPSGRYELREQLSTASTGATWRAWDRDTEREVDIRQLRPPQQLAPEQRHAMVARRARAALRAQRVGRVAGLVPVLDVLASDDEVLVVTDVAPGQSLAELMRDRGRMSTDRAIAVAASLARTLESLHSSGLAHGDVRPSRVRVDGDDTHLVAHGLARPDEDEPEATLLASPAYLSPERASGSRVGPTDDVWALGVLLYSMVEGAPPFSGHSVDELLTAIARDEAPRAASAPAPVAGAIATMLAKDPRRRPSIVRVRELLEYESDAGPAAVTSTASTAGPTAVTSVDPNAAFAATQTPGPPVKPLPVKPLPVKPLPAEPRAAAPAEPPAAATSQSPAAATSRAVPAARDDEAPRHRTARRTESTGGPDWQTVVPLVGIVVLLLISWYLLSRF